MLSMIQGEVVTRYGWVSSQEFTNSQISSAETTGIHRLWRLILADRPIVKVGAAISATTAGRIPLKMR
mgnify:CR=1 FL=1